MGERLRALTNAILLARRFNGDFLFEWKERSEGGKAFHSIEPADEFFSPDFLNKHYLHDPLSLDIKPLTNPSKIEKGMHSKPHRLKRTTYSVPKLTRLEINSSPYLEDSGFNHDEVSSAFQQIGFSSVLAQAISLARSTEIPVNAVAMHVRAGDIIYGRHSNGLRYVTKGCPFQAAQLLLDKLIQEEKAIILFAQDRALGEYLADSPMIIPAYMLIPAGLESNSQQAMFEMVLMSRCARIYAEGSGFATLAALISGKIIQSANKEIGEKVILEAILTSSNHKELSVQISRQQKIFSFRWALARCVSRLGSEQLARICTQALDLEPDNWLFKFAYASCLFREGTNQEAVDLTQSLLDNANKSVIRKLLEPGKLSKRIQGSLDYLVEPYMVRASNGCKLSAKLLSLANPPITANSTASAAQAASIRCSKTSVSTIPADLHVHFEACLIHYLVLEFIRLLIRLSCSRKDWLSAETMAHFYPTQAGSNYSRIISNAYAFRIIYEQTDSALSEFIRDSDQRIQAALGVNPFTLVGSQFVQGGMTSLLMLRHVLKSLHNQLISKLPLNQGIVKEDLVLHEKISLLLTKKYMQNLQREELLYNLFSADRLCSPVRHGSVRYEPMKGIPLVSVFWQSITPARRTVFSDLLGINLRIWTATACSARDCSQSTGCDYTFPEQEKLFAQVLGYACHRQADMIWVLEEYAKIVGFVRALPMAIIHLDLHMANVLCTDSAVYAIDWDKWCWGPVGFGLIANPSQLAALADDPWINDAAVVLCVSSQQLLVSIVLYNFLRSVKKGQLADASENASLLWAAIS